MPTQPRPIRLSEEDIDILGKLSRAWGPVQPLGTTAVIRESIRRAWQAEELKNDTTKPARKEKVQ
jgi:hypothetical protein